MSRPDKANSFNPDAARSKNGQFMGFTFTEAEAGVVLLCAPWSTVARTNTTTHSAPANILDASYAIPLHDPDVPDAWQMGIYCRLPEEKIVEQGKQLAEKAAAYTMQAGGKEPSGKALSGDIDTQTASLNKWLEQEATRLMGQKKRVGLIGGDSSTQIGLLEALGKRYSEFGILHLGAETGLSSGNSGPAYCPGNLFTHAREIDSVVHLSLAGARFLSPAEEKYVEGREDIAVYYHHEIRRRLYRGHTFSQVCGDIIRGLPDQAYISFDINALQSQYCPNADQNTPGGFDLDEALYLIKRLVDAEIEIIGFGLCGVAGQGHYPDGQVGAVLAYRMANLMGSSSW